MLFINIVVVFSAIIKLSTARQCFVCGVGADEPFKSAYKNSNKTKNGTLAAIEGQPMVVALTCDEYDRAESRDIFIRECPSDYIGCITQIEGTQVTRTCDTLPINDCQTANGIKYCYCNTDLCNTKIAPIPNNAHNHRTSIPTDDEDLLDGSGSSDTETDEADIWRSTTDFTNVLVPTQQFTNSNATTTTHSQSHSIRISVDFIKIALLQIVFFISTLSLVI